MSRRAISEMNESRVELPGRDPLLPWLIFTGVSLFALVLLWYFGLIERMVVSDRTYISSIIVLLYVASSLHCLWRILIISREGEAAVKTAQVVVRKGGGLLTAAPAEGKASLPAGLVAAHIRDLVTKAALQGAERLDQTLLLRVLAARLRGSNQFGAFASDTLMKLGLLGTIIGFIMMLAPIAGLDPENREAVRSSMSLMSAGMAVAMYTTLVGLAGSILLKVQYAHAGQRHGEDLRFRRRSDGSPCRLGARQPGGHGMIDDFDLLPREDAFDPFSVVLFKALQVLAFLFFIALLIVAPKAKEGKVDSKAEFLITVDWPDNHPDDIDTFVQDPLGNVAWFRRREAGFMVLDRDDRGGINDFVMVNGNEGTDRNPAGTGQHSRHRRGRIYGECLSFHRPDRRGGPGDGDGPEAQSRSPRSSPRKRSSWKRAAPRKGPRCASPWMRRARSRRPAISRDRSCRPSTAPGETVRHDRIADQRPLSSPWPMCC